MNNICQRCEQNQARVEVNHNIGGQLSSEKLCRSCFEDSFGAIAAGPLAAMMDTSDIVSGQ